MPLATGTLPARRSGLKCGLRGVVDDDAGVLEAFDKDTVVAEYECVDCASAGVCSCSFPGWVSASFRDGSITRGTTGDAAEARLAGLPRPSLVAVPKLSHSSSSSQTVVMDEAEDKNALMEEDDADPV